MKFWRCPECKREREFVGCLVMKVCDACQCEMEVVDGS